MRLSPGLPAKLFLLLVSTALSIVLAEGLFRIYENRFLLGDETPGSGSFDLAGMNYNDTQISRGKPAGEFRALSIGDSFAYTIVRPQYTYHSIASARASEKAGRPVRLVNLGQPSSSFPQYHAALDVWTDRLEYDALVANIYLGNDLLDIAYGYVPLQQQMNRQFEDLDYSIETGAPRIGVVPEKFGLRLLDHLYAHWRQQTATRQPLSDDPRYNRALNLLREDVYLEHARIQMHNWEPDRLEKLRPAYEAARDFIRRLSAFRAQGIPVLVLLSPNEAQVDAHLREELIKARGPKRGPLVPDLPNRILQRLITAIDPQIEVLDLLELLRCAQQSGSDMYYGTDTHWSAEGNELVGQALARHLLQTWLQEGSRPSGDWPLCLTPIEHSTAGSDSAEDHDADRFVQSLLETAPSS